MNVSRARNRERISFIVVLLSLAACGGKAAGVSAIERDAGMSAVRVPRVHRASALICPTERQPIAPTSLGCTGQGHCDQDSDCASGSNGRCLNVGDCATSCSYDECVTDSDCAEPLVCLCRPEGDDFVPNQCTHQGSCRTDSDCAGGEYCSPSLVTAGCICANCGRGYFCHSPADTCLDDSDCGGEACAYDESAQHFACLFCQPHL